MCLAAPARLSPPWMMGVALWRLFWRRQNRPTPAGRSGSARRRVAFHRHCAAIRSRPTPQSDVVYLLVALLAVLSGAMLIGKISTLRILMLITLGRSWCPLAEAMAAPRNAAAKVRVKAELTKRAKI